MIPLKMVKKTEIKCPRCDIVYEVDDALKEIVTCLKCGCSYLQAIHDVNRPEFIRQAAYRCRGER